MITNGDKLIVTKSTSFLNKGDIVMVVDVNEESDIFSYVHEGNYNRSGMMSLSMCEKHFEKVFEEKRIPPSITPESIEEIMENSTFEAFTVFDKCTIVACKLPNGFVIVESSACVSPENYDKEMGASICIDRIKDKVWELEGYRLQEELYREDTENFDCPCEFCDDCEGCVYIYREEDEEIDECLSTDLDCDECEDFDCPHNTNVK